MKRSQAFEDWLRDKTQRDRVAAFFSGLGLFCLSAVALLVTFWIVYLVVFLGFEWLVPHSHVMRMAISGVVLVLLFIGNATTDRRYLETLSFSTGTVHKKPVTIYIPGVGLGSTINPLAPDSINSFTKVITTFLFIGPRLATAAVRSLARIPRLSARDIEGCAAVLAVLGENDSPVAFAELAAAIANGHEVPVVLEQVLEIDGVRFSPSTPGLSLYSELREELPKSRHKRAGVQKAAPDRFKSGGGNN